MAVPKKKTSKCKSGMRRAHLGIKKVNVAIDSVSGELKLSHHISLVDGRYNNRQVLEKKEA